MLFDHILITGEMIVMRKLTGLGAVMAAASLAAQTPVTQAGSGISMGGGTCAANPYNCADAPNPIAAPSTIWLEEMTWMDVRDALKAGKTTIIISTGGIEPNGPWLATGHNYVLQTNCEAIANKGTLPAPPRAPRPPPQ